MGYSIYDDGSFWMPFKDFLAEFGQVYINKLHEDYFYSFKALNMRDSHLQSDEWAIFPFTVTGTKAAPITHAFVSISQKNPRHFEKEPVEYDVSFARIIVVKGTPDRPECMVKEGNTFHCKNDTVVEIKLSPGQYFAYVEVDWV